MIVRSVNITAQMLNKKNSKTYIVKKN
jgi:hypothetical protein